jgi:hypothetical protein
MKKNSVCEELINRFMKKMVIVVGFYVLATASAYAAYPASWPSDSSWITYTRLSGAIQDLSSPGGDASDGGTGINPNSVDVFNGTSGTLPSIYFYFDATNNVFFYRMRLLGDPTGNGNTNPLQQFTWNCLLDTDGDGYKEFFVEANGLDDYLYVYYGNTNQQDITSGATCAANGQGLVWSQPITSGTHIRIINNTATGGGYFLDWQVPISAFVTCSGAAGLTPNTPFSMAFTTSTTTQNPTKKDFVGAGNFVMGNSTLLPGSDLITLNGGIIQAPQITNFAGTCGGGVNASPVTLDVKTLDTLVTTNGVVVDTIQSVTFYYQINGGSTWTQIGSSVTAPVSGTVNDWSISWVTSSLAAGTYRIRVDVKDDEGHTTTNTSNLINLASCNGVTYVDMVSCKISLTKNNQALIEWQTGYEADNLGFNVYREEEGKRQLVNQQVVAGSALKAGTSTVLASGLDYKFFDKQASPAAAYWIEDLDLKGTSTWHGPYFLSQDKPVIRDDQPSLALPNLGLHEAEMVAESEATRVVEAVAVEPQEAGKKRKNTLSAAALQLQALLPSTSFPYLKIGVKNEGWYRLTQADLQAAGFPSISDARKLQLFVDGQEIPIYTASDRNGVFQSLEFYGIGLNTVASNIHSYLLMQGTKNGLRITQAKVDGLPSSSQSFSQTVERRDRTIYFSSLRNGEKENFFGAVVTAAALTNQTLTLKHLSAESGQQGIIEVALQGVTLVPHRVQVQINGQIAGEVLYSGQENGVGKFAVPNSVLREGANTISLIAINAGGDVSLVDYLRISYPHTYEADNDFLSLNVKAGERTIVSGFSTNDIRVFDVTNPASVQELTGSLMQTGDSYSVSFGVQGSGERSVIAQTSNKAKTPDSLKTKTRAGITDADKAADYIIITSAGLLRTVEPLKLKRTGEGIKTTVIDIDDIYDEFNNGNKSPKAIKDYLQFTRSAWKIVPRFVLLAGDASYDSKNYLGAGNFDFVPTKLMDTSSMESASDDWLVDFNNDGLPEMAIGRLPVRTEAEATLIINKILGYAQVNPQPSAMLISDANDGYSYEDDSAKLRPFIPSAISVTEVKRGSLDAATAKAQLLDGLASGQKFVNYVGHGSLNLWRGSLLTADEAKNLTNGNKLPLFISMTCMNGFFQDPNLESLAEALLKAERGGAVAVWASSAITKAEQQAMINREVVRQLMENSQTITVGEAVKRAKSAVNDSDVRLSWILFGDPTMKLQ